MSEKNDKSKAPGLQKLLLISACLLLCALVYFFVQATAQDRSVIALSSSPALDSPSPSASYTPTATPVIGLRTDVVMERLGIAGVTLVQKLYTVTDYEVGHWDETQLGALTFTILDGYIRGFSLTISGMQKPPAVPAKQTPSSYDEAYSEIYDRNITEQNRRLYLLFPKLLDAIDADGAFSPATALAWCVLAEQARDDDKLMRDKADGYGFTAAYFKDGSLTLAVNIE